MICRPWEVLRHNGRHLTGSVVTLGPTLGGSTPGPHWVSQSGLLFNAVSHTGGHFKAEFSLVTSCVGPHSLAGCELNTGSQALEEKHVWGLVSSGVAQGRTGSCFSSDLCALVLICLRSWPLLYTGHHESLRILHACLSLDTYEVIHRNKVSKPFAVV